MKQQVAMTDDQIATVATEVLKRAFKELGFEDAVVDFDGASIIRVEAHATHPVPVKRLTTALHEIRSRLIDRGEDRFVFLDALDPHEVIPIDEDVE